MRLADFIEDNAQSIVDGAQVFAETIAPEGGHLDAMALRDHIPQILEAIVLDLRTAQSPGEQQLKSEGRGPVSNGPRSAAATHGRLRAKGGFDVNHMIAEYRALRAAVLRLWTEHDALTADSLEDLIRFNEAIDQAVAESVADFVKEADSWRQVFLGVLGHDLRGPLSVIITTSELLSRMTQDSPYSATTERIVRSGMRMAKLLDDLLDYNRTQFGMGIRVVRKECDLVDEIAQEITLLRDAINEVPIRFDYAEGCQGRFDASRVREAINNLVVNASKYGDPGTDILVSLVRSAEKVEVTVSNTGRPVETSLLAAMFDPLKRGNGVASKGEHASLGLGLFIVREIARAHGGELKALCGNGKTEFTLSLAVE